MSNLYHILGFIPATEAWEMLPAREALARRLVESGKLRVNADTERNFVRLGATASDKTLTARELTDPKLAAATRAELARHVAPAEGEDGFARLYARLMEDLKKARGVAAEKEMKVARVLVQSAEPEVIELLLASGTEVFVSYSHNVSDLMAVHEWQTNGMASGMQATGSEGTAVFVSAGGDPFFEGEQKHYVTDGFPALARMVVIAGQELGHFADLRRTKRGIMGRHSTDPHHSALRATPAARDGRLADMRNVAALAESYHRAGLAGLRRAETGVAFYVQRKMRFSPPWIFYQLWRLAAWTGFVLQSRSTGNHLKLKIYPYHRLGNATTLFLADMAFNLAPDADVYRHPDPLVEEAIAVIEAVARVPQQVHKWGHAAVALAWPNLYRFYYETVMPANRATLGAALKYTEKTSILQKLMIFLRRARSNKPGWYP